MKATFWSCLIAATVLGTLVFCLCQRTLNELRAGNDSLRHQLQVPEPAAETNVVQLPGDSLDALSPDERLELLRLRGQVAPLRRELQGLSNRVATLAESSSRRETTPSARLLSSDPAVRRAEIERRNAYFRSEPYRNVRNLSIALGRYIKSHSGELPDDLASLEASANHAFAPDTSERFELMRRGKIPEEARAYTLVAREKQPEQLADGSWRRHYVKADGGTWTAGLGPASKPDWKARERSAEKELKQLEILPRTNASP